MKSSSGIGVHAGWLLLFAGLCLAGTDHVFAADYVPFEGEKSTWHDGFERFDFLLDEATLEIAPFQRPDGEKSGVQDPPAGKRRCIVVIPKKPAEGHPWSWQACYWNHEPQAEVELLRRGYHVAYLSANAALKPDKTWEAWYAYLTEKHGLSTRPAFVGMSRGGEYAYTWSTRHPDKVSCIYGDNPAIHPDALGKLADLARADVPLLHVCGSLDPLLDRCSNTIETIYRQFGGRISVIIKEGAGHHPHSLRDPKPIADFITASFRADEKPVPDFVSGRSTRTAFYGAPATYDEVSQEGTFLTRRGPFFGPAYDRYVFSLDGVEGTVQAILPKKAAAGNPWVLRADIPSAASTVDLALLAEGVAIVVGPVPYNADGPHLEHWNKVYVHLTSRGFSKRPVLAGSGGAAGEAYAWAIANPEKVACLYAENPMLRCTMSKAQPMDGLGTLAKARVAIIHSCGTRDPLLDRETRVAERKYRELGGEFALLAIEGSGPLPTPPRKVSLIVKLILEHIGRRTADSPAP